MRANVLRHLWLIFYTIPIYSYDFAVKLSSAARRARNSLNSSSPSFSAQPATIRIPRSTSARRNSVSGVETAMSCGPQNLSGRSNANVKYTSRNSAVMPESR
jgi:hypothetical protein